LADEAPDAGDELGKREKFSGICFSARRERDRRVRRDPLERDPRNFRMRSAQSLTPEASWSSRYGSAPSFLFPNDTPIE
jgi:hypothetical protein